MRSPCIWIPCNGCTFTDTAITSTFTTLHSTIKGFLLVQLTHQGFIDQQSSGTYLAGNGTYLLRGGENCLYLALVEKLPMKIINP